MSIIIECEYEPPHTHEYPDDWIFGGANGRHPGADPRHRVSSYTYYDENAQPIHITCTPLCDDQAIDEFTKVASFGPKFRPKWLSVRRPDGTQEMFKLTYDKDTDLVTEVTS